MAQDRPVHEIRLGKVKAAIWRNETEAGQRHSVSITRIYKSETGWETSSSFGRDELPLVSKVADQAHLWIYQQSERTDAEPAKSNAQGSSSSGRQKSDRRS